MTDQTVMPPSRPRRLTSSIKNLLPRLPEKGHVKIGALGEKRTARSGREYAMPTKLDHFRITTLERGPDGNFLIDRAIHERLGDKPTEIPVRLLYDDIELNMPTRYACYAGRTLFCSGDGESAIRISARPGEKALPEPLTVQCPCHRQEPGYTGADKCKPNGRLSFLIEGVSGVGGVFVFRTTSFNSITGLLSSMGFLRSVTGGILANIPLMLRIQAKQATNPADQTPVLIYIVTLEFAGDIAELQQIGHQIALARATTHLSIAHIEDEAKRMLQLAPPSNAPLPGDNADDVVEEFYPEQAEEGWARARGEPTEPEPPRGVVEPEPNTVYTIIDLDSVEHEFSTAAAAVDALEIVFRDAATRRKRSAMEAAYENNEAAIAALSAVDDQTLQPILELWHEAVHALERQRAEPAPREAFSDAAGTQDQDPAGQGEALGSGGPGASPATDLLGMPPVDDLVVPLQRHPKPSDLDYFGRQLLALIGEAPWTSQRRAQIRRGNEYGISLLKASKSDELIHLYDEINEALAAAS